MTPRKTISNKQEVAKYDLRSQAHAQKLEMLYIAEKSKQPEIRKEALKEIKRIERDMRRQDSKLQPVTAMWLISVWVLMAVACCWYAILKYSMLIATELWILVIGVTLLMVLVCLTLTGHVSETSLVAYIFKLWDRIVTRDRIPE